MYMIERCVSCSVLSQGRLSFVGGTAVYLSTETSSLNTPCGSLIPSHGHGDSLSELPEVLDVLTWRVVLLNACLALWLLTV